LGKKHRFSIFFFSFGFFERLIDRSIDSLRKKKIGRISIHKNIMGHYWQSDVWSGSDLSEGLNVKQGRINGWRRYKANSLG
jgi:hypothetical protein